jgi:hypothetical protein
VILSVADSDLPRLHDEHVVADVAFPDDVLAVRDDDFRFTGDAAAASRLGAPAGRFHPLRVHQSAPYGRDRVCAMTSLMPTARGIVAGLQVFNGRTRS